jgi:hypothetical protein
VRLVELPGGVALEDGTRMAAAQVRPLLGDDEDWLADCPAELPTAAVANELVRRVTVALGDGRAPPAGWVRSLPVADRDYLVLAVRRLTLGERFEAIFDCPSCGDRTNLSFRASEIPVEHRPQHRATYETTVRAADGSALPITFHLPTAGEQEDAARAGDRAAELLQASCVEAVDGRAAGEPELNQLGEQGWGELDVTIAGLAPRIDLELAVTCLGCGESWDIDFDLATFMLQELHLVPGQLAREVHALAFHYHWSRREILALTRAKRRGHLELISDELLHGEQLWP